MRENNNGILDCTMNHLTLHAPFLENLGLYNGKLGIIIVLYQYAHIVSNKIYEEIANNLLEDTLSHLPSSMPIGLADGICGIGWGICHLLENHFVEGEANEILQEIDNKILEFNPLRIIDLSLETGLEGIATYLSKRDKLLDYTNPYSEEYRINVKSRIEYDCDRDIEHFINAQKAIHITLENNWYQLGLNNGCAGKAWLLMKK